MFNWLFKTSSGRLIVCALSQVPFVAAAAILAHSKHGTFEAGFFTGILYAAYLMLAVIWIMFPTIREHGQEEEEKDSSI